MKSPFFIALALALCAAASIHAADPLDIGSHRELFVDRFLIENLHGVELRLHEPHDEGVVLSFDKPWEGAFCAYSTVLKDGSKYRLYYRGKGAGGDGKGEVTCYAESDDGLRWTKPNLGLHEIAGSTNNNVILTGSGITHNFSPFLDAKPGTPATQRFKALGGLKDKTGGGLHALTSEDGIHWNDLHDGPVITHGAFDSQNVSFWSELEQCYVCFMRIFIRHTGADGKVAGLRSVARSTSPDFEHWTEPEPMKFQPAQEYHLYTSQTQPYFRAPHLYIATAARFMQGRPGITDEDAKRLQVDPAYYKTAKDVSDSVLLTSRDGRTYDQTFREALIRPGLDLAQWVSRSGYPALNVVQTGPAEMSLYANQNYGQPTAHLRRYSLRLDGFASVQAPYDSGELLTKPLRFTGHRPEINFSTSAAGFIRVEIQDESGKPVGGFRAEECTEILQQASFAWKSKIVRKTWWVDFAPVHGNLGK